MRLLITGIVVTVLLLGFVFVWIYLASQGQVPVIRAPLESVSTEVRILVLLVIVAALGALYLRSAPANRKGQ